MGTIYRVACTECKVARDLDKFGDRGEGIETRDQSLKYSETLGGDLRTALLVSFMVKHKGHACVFFDEHERDELNPYINEEYKHDTDFWCE